MQGTRGPLCESCDNFGLDTNGETFVNSAPFVCVSCDDKFSSKESYFFLVLSVIFVFLMASLSIFNHIRSIDLQATCRYLRIMNILYLGMSSMLSMLSGSYLKLLIHYFQIIQVLNSLNLPRPSAYIK